MNTWRGRAEICVSLMLMEYLVVVPMYDGEGCLLRQLLRERPVMEEGLSALPSANLSDAGHVQTSSLPVFLGRLPAQAGQVRV